MRFFFTGPRVLGIRPGISFGADDFRKLARPRQASGAGQMTGGFVYVLKDASGRHKIGSSRDPIARISQLQTGSAEPLDFAFIGVAPEGSYTRIERAAHDLLENQKIPGAGEEWFRVPASIAIGAVMEVSHRLGEPIQQVAPVMVPQIIHLANQPDSIQPSRAHRIQMRILWSLGGVFLIMVALIVLGSFAPHH